MTSSAPHLAGDIPGASPDAAPPVAAEGAATDASAASDPVPSTGVSPSARRRSLTVGDYVGSTSVDAIAGVRGLGLRPLPDRQETEDTASHGVVLAQHPDPGAEAARGEQVVLYVGAPVLRRSGGIPVHPPAARAAEPLPLPSDPAPAPDAASPAAAAIDRESLDESFADEPAAPVTDGDPLAPPTAPEGRPRPLAAARRPSTDDGEAPEAPEAPEATPRRRMRPRTVAVSALVATILAGAAVTAVSGGSSAPRPAAPATPTLTTGADHAPQINRRRRQTNPPRHHPHRTAGQRGAQPRHDSHRATARRRSHARATTRGTPPASITSAAAPVPATLAPAPAAPAPTPPYSPSPSHTTPAPATAAPAPRASSALSNTGRFENGK